MTCRREFVTGYAAGGVGVLPANRAGICRVGVDVSAELSRQSTASAICFDCVVVRLKVLLQNLGDYPKSGTFTVLRELFPERAATNVSPGFVAPKLVSRGDGSHGPESRNTKK